jgi:hypothetical protein
LLSSKRREIPMPIARYMVWVGTSLLALLFAANWFFPAPLPEPAHEAIDKPVIRITSIQCPPERVVIDTNQPTIVPPPALFESASSGNPSPLQSYASVGPSPMPIDVAKKRPKANKQRDPGAATYQPTLSNTRPVARGGSATSVPSTSLSFAQIMSGQLLRNLFNRH